MTQIQLSICFDVLAWRLAQNTQGSDCWVFKSQFGEGSFAKISYKQTLWKALRKFPITELPRCIGIDCCFMLISQHLNP